MKVFRNVVTAMLLVVIFALSFSCQQEQTVTPQNVIIIIGDGAGFNQLQAGSLYLHGEKNALTAHDFPIQVAATTYSASGFGYDAQQVQADFGYLKQKPTDSAASGTALSTGTKTYNGAIGVDTLKQPLTHVFTMAEDAGKATGVVTSVQFSHATPAAFIAHNESRGNYHAIAREMILDSRADVIMGCGHPFYTDDSHRLPEPNYKMLSEEEWQALQDGTAGGDADGDGQADSWTFVEYRQDFQALTEGDTPNRVFGMPQVASTLQADRSGAEEQTEPYFPPLNENIPTLAEMAQGAINVLDNDPDGFYLMIEAGAIDWACHGNHGPRMLEEVIDLENTIKAVVEWVETNSSWDETLVIVTADHETGYLTGPESGAVATASGDSTAQYNALVGTGQGNVPELEFHSGGHTNSLVPVLAKGAGSDGLTTLADQEDPMWGAYLDNTDIPNYLKGFLVE